MTPQEQAQAQDLVAMVEHAIDSAGSVIVMPGSKQDLQRALDLVWEGQGATTALVRLSLMRSMRLIYAYEN